MAEQKRPNGGGANPDGRGPDRGRHVAATLLDKTKEFFQTCDIEEKGFITRTDMRRLHRELPLSAEELEDVFDSLDSNHDGYLTLEAFSSGFSQFLRGRRISVAEDTGVSPAAHGLRAKEALYQTQWDAKLAGEEDDEEKHFSMLLDSLGASSVFEDPGEVRSLWAQLRRDEPHLLSNFEEFLSRVTSQIKEAHKERKDMESALQRKAATHNSEICSLYEEMEAQIKNEKDIYLLKCSRSLPRHGTSPLQPVAEQSETEDSREEVDDNNDKGLCFSKSSEVPTSQQQDAERLQIHSQELEQQLFSKERELEHLVQKQRRLELQCRELSTEKQENVKLKMTCNELSRDLAGTSQELALAQEQLTILEEQAAQLKQDKEMEMYRITEGLQREKQSLMKQLDLLREMNKHLKDERDMSFGAPKPRSSLRQKQKQRTSLGNFFDDSSQPTKMSFQYLEALPIEHLQIVFVASSSCSEDDTAPPTNGKYNSNRPPRQQQHRPSSSSSSSSSSSTARGMPGSRQASNGNAGVAKTAAPQRGKARAKKTASTSKIPVSKSTRPEMGTKGRGVGGGGGVAEEDEVLDAPPDGWPLRRIISIEEDHLPHLLYAGSGQPLLHQLSEEDEEEKGDDEDDSNEEEGEAEEEKEERGEESCDLEGGAVTTTEASACQPPPAYTAPVVTPAPAERRSRFARTKKTLMFPPMFPRGQPVGKETQHMVKEGPSLTPERLFKVLLIGNSSVGKTSLLRSFCEGRFHTSTTATVGIDYSVKSLTLDNTQIAMQLWDTAGQERYRSITKQFFRRADGVVLMYDITVADSFRDVRPWLANIQEAAGEAIPILLLGNKMDMEGDREVSHKMAEQLACESKMMFFEVSAYTGCNVSESLTHLARVLKEQEDRVRDTVIILSGLPVKKKACCK